MSSEPIRASGLAGRYAHALFELADDRKVLDTVAAELSALHALIGESADLRRLLASPAIARTDQARALDAVLDRAGACETTRSFIALVARNRRLFALPGMIAAFGALLAHRRGEVTAEVTSAHPLNDDQQAALGAALRQVTGASVSMNVSVDPELIGGLVVRVGSRMIDSSLRTKLQKLQFVLKGAA